MIAPCLAIAAEELGEANDLRTAFLAASTPQRDGAGLLPARRGHTAAMGGRDMTAFDRSNGPPWLVAWCNRHAVWMFSPREPPAEPLLAVTWF